MFAALQPTSAWLCLLYLTTEKPLCFWWLLRVIRATASSDARASMWKLDVPAYRSYHQCTEHQEPQPHQNMTQIRPLQPKLRRFTRGIPYATQINLVIYICGNEMFHMTHPGFMMYHWPMQHVKFCARRIVHLCRWWWLHHLWVLGCSNNVQVIK